MTDKIYRTAQGKTIDLGALILKNEKVRAVGNMNVNARGDLIDDANRVIDPKAKQVQRQVNKTVSAVRPGSPAAPQTQPVVKPEEPVAQLDPEEAADLAALEAEFESPELKTETAPAAESGLAAAMSKAKKKDKQ